VKTRASRGPAERQKNGAFKKIEEFREAGATLLNAAALIITKYRCALDSPPSSSRVHLFRWSPQPFARPGSIGRRGRGGIRRDAVGKQVPRRV
jgi:hypothetical protein